MTNHPARGRTATHMGPTSEVVAQNVARLRAVRGFTTRELEALLRQADQPISASGISRIETYRRAVTADELAALAVVFGVSPSALLAPLSASSDELVEVSGGGGPVPSEDVWAWADGQRPLRVTSGRQPTEILEHRLHGRPQWLWGNDG